MKRARPKAAGSSGAGAGGAGAGAAAAAASSSAPSATAAALQRTRARIVAALPQLDSSALASILVTLLEDDSVVRTVAALPIFNQAPALVKCAACKKEFDANMNLSRTACVSEKHAFGCHDRGECPGCRDWDGCCSYCNRCGATECESEGFLGGGAHAGTSTVCRIGRHTTEYPFEDEDEEED